MKRSDRDLISAIRGTCAMVERAAFDGRERRGRAR